MKEIFSARKALEACLTISALCAEVMSRSLAESPVESSNCLK
jgi:hypothetical protein